MPHRSELVEALRYRLQEATECAEPDVLRAVTVDVDKKLASLPFPLPSRSTSFREAEVDPRAEALYPADAPPGMVPLAGRGVGDRLFEAASVLLLGDGSLSMELQLRTMVEMVLHKRYYLNGMIDSKVMLQAARYSLCTEESAHCMNLPMAILEAIFDADVKATSYPGAFTNMWHVYALASVLQSDIYSIYPMRNLKIRPYFNRLIGPRSRPPGPPLPTLHIMWAGEPLSQDVFRPQYFAPVVPLRGLDRPAPPLKTLELLNAEPDISYSVLRERYSITKSTFYRWKRQSREHRRRAAARYEARHYLQRCFAEGGGFLPLQQFRSRFPDISRSTYYAWKHEMVLLAGGRLPPGPGTATEPEPGGGGAPRGGEGSAKEVVGPSAQRSPSMQQARSFLQECVLLNACPPYRSFRKSYPWISRSTYYNWRREAMCRTRDGHQHHGNGRASGLAPPPPTSRLGSSGGGKSHPPPGQAAAPSFPARLRRVRQWQRLRQEARRRAQSWQMPLSALRVRFPSISTATFLRWWALAQKTGSREPRRPHRESPAPVTVPQAGASSVPEIPGARVMPEPNGLAVWPLAPATQHGPSSKAKAKLFLQRRYVSRDFPTFREFSGYFPHTPRSTYYMWKRALSNGMMLMHCPGAAEEKQT
ncbi:vertnin [Hemitrygon akajei]|uniref:vertnin n=1 Tax=Hemitrygon akajei TaxID=2704970 RepID=UPI003BF9EBA6